MTTEQYILHALHLADQARGHCAPNPCVGAIVVRNNQIIAQGYHHGPGKPHAEAEALQQAGSNAKGASLYITLEPCCHYGRTPPCTDAIEAAGIKNVYYAFDDPNPQVRGLSQQHLEKRGIEVTKVSVDKVNEFYQSYQYWWQHKRPWLTIKLAMSLDGKIAGSEGKTIMITGSECQRFTHQQRLRSDAILTSVNTIIKDNPQMNVRVSAQPQAKPVYIIDTQLQIPENAYIWNTAKSLTLLHSEQATQAKIQAVIQKGARCIAINTNGTRLDLSQVLHIIGLDGIQDLWVEAGGRLTQAFLEERLVQRAYFYVAAKSLGENALTGLSKAMDFSQQAKTVHWQGMGSDAICQLDW